MTLENFGRGLAKFYFDVARVDPMGVTRLIFMDGKYGWRNSDCKLIYPTCW